MKVGIYARVSTKDKGQEVVNQLRQLREFAALQVWTVYRAYIAHPDGKGLPALVALAENVVSPPIAGKETPFDRLVRGRRPPFFADFFDESLFMRVALRRKRFQMQIRSDVAWIDDP